MRRQARADASDLLSVKLLGERDEVGQVMHEPDAWARYWDDIFSKELDPALVCAARAEDLTVVDQMGVWEFRPLSECLSITGRRPVKVSWVDVNKGDGSAPNVRSRIVAEDFRTDARPDLFAATPPLEFLRYLCSRCASTQLDGRCTRIMVQDVKKAYFYAPATRPIYVELPRERAQPGMCAKLHKSLYGTRDAALN